MLQRVLLGPTSHARKPPTRNEAEGAAKEEGVYALHNAHDNCLADSVKTRSGFFFALRLRNDACRDKVRPTMFAAASLLAILSLSLLVVLEVGLIRMSREAAKA